MRTVLRAVVATCVATLAVPLWAAPAAAETTTETASSAAYFNSAGTPKLETPATLPNPAASADGVAPGNLAVAAQQGREDKVSFLYFSLSNVPTGATISSAVLTVPLVPADNANVRLNAAPEKVAACAIVGSGFSAEDGETLTVAPERACGTAKVVGAGDDTAYTFDITNLATMWATMNDGLALTRDPDKSDTFQVVLSRDATLAVEYVPLAENEPGTSDTGTVTVEEGSGTTSVGGFDSGSFAGDTTGGSFSDTSSAPLTAPLTGGSAPLTAPETATETPAVAARPSAAVGPVEDLSPTPGFWLGALLLAAVLAVLGLILGDPRVPAAAASRPTRLSRALSTPAGRRPSLLG